MSLFAKIPLRANVVFAHDIVMAALSFLLALYLRLGDNVIYYSPELLFQGTIAFAVISAVIFWFMGLYRGVWRYASLNDMIAITRSVTLSILIFLVVMFLWTRLHAFPRSLPFINWFVLMALLGAPRFFYRLLKDRRFEWRWERDPRGRVPVLLVGAGDGAELFIRSLTGSAAATYRPVGIVAEGPGRVGRRIHGVEVLGVLDDIAAVLAGLTARGDRPNRLVLTKDTFDGATVRALLDVAAKAGMTLARLPRLTDLRSESGDRVEVRPVAVEDLLGRPQATLDHDAMAALVRGRRVLVTGAGGSIGAELVRQVSALAPGALMLLDHSEYNLYSVDLETAEQHPALPRWSVLADVRDRARIGRLFRELAPELVFHAAALKHVPLVEGNVIEGVLTNAVGTAVVADACVDARARAMVLISTDKAVNPTSVMGASKRIAEMYCQALDLAREDGVATRFVTVRFGNVLGSTGSVVPLFQRQLARGGPLTVTHPEITRYFMTVREAVELVLQATSLGLRDGRDEGKIYVLDMGEPVRILDLARQMIRLAGLRPDEDVKIEFIGLRPGEKLAEEIFHGGEPLVPTECGGILLAAPRAADRAGMAEAVAQLAAAAAAADRARVTALLRRLVPESRLNGEALPRAAS